MRIMSSPTELYFSTEGLPFPPSVNGYLGHRVARGIVMAYTKPEAKKFQKVFGERLRQIRNDTGWDVEVTRDTHYYLDITFYMPRTNIDENNLQKVAIDVLETEGIIINDKHLVTRTQAVYYDSKNPYAEYYLHPVEYTGIFPNEYQKDIFAKKCESCTRFLDGRCSILKDSLKGKIREEITYNETHNNGYITHENISCTKYKKKEKK